MRTEKGWILIDTGCSVRRDELDAGIERAGCRPGDLELIILTHGDFDHCGNARHLRERFACRIAMHRDDLGMVERGDMFWNRGKSNPLVRMVAPLFFGFSNAHEFTPDLYVEDGYELSGYRPLLRVVALPGHSRGSIGVMTTAGDLFCGDLLINEKKPVLNYRIDDPVAARASVEKLRGLGINMVFPSHGEQFPMKEFLDRWPLSILP